MTPRAAVQTYLKELQERISSTFASLDGGVFQHDDWQHHSGGGGQSRVLQNGAVLEKCGVNFSAVDGIMPEKMANRMQAKSGTTFFATGVSVVLHPRNPFVPIVHCNFRYFELLEDGYCTDSWFGGGADLTPCYPFLEDTKHFHQTFKNALEPFGTQYYPQFKQQCDQYFYLPHRQETRGIGGIFFDHLRQNHDHYFALLQATGNAFLDAYIPILEKRKDMVYTEHNRYWQEVRRGRYAEFNLAFDRGTQFGLETNGRIESILMSLPPVTRWLYNYQPEANSAEAAALEFFQARDWLKD